MLHDASEEERTEWVDPYRGKSAFGWDVSLVFTILLGIFGTVFVGILRSEELSPSSTAGYWGLATGALACGVSSAYFLVTFLGDVCFAVKKYRGK